MIKAYGIGTMHPGKTNCTAAMRKLSLFSIIILVPFLIHAQIRVGLLGGPQWASVLETNNIGGWDTAAKPHYSSKVGAHIGFMGEISLGKNFYLHPAIMYSSKGRKFYKYDSLAANDKDTVSIQRTLNSNYIDIPFNISYKIPLSKKKPISLLLSAGPYFSFLYNGNKTSEIKVYDSTVIKVKSTKSDLEPGKGTDKYKTSDFGVNARAGFDLGGVMITGFMSQGLTSFYTANYDGDFKHRVYGASLTIWLNKAEKKTTPKVVNLDIDFDGVPDATDLCPTVFGDSLFHGCPADKDSDGIIDIKDKCPEIAGLQKYDGCPIPDSDVDGVNDEQDSCKQIAGLSKYNGCPIPDKDGDGVNDELDQCVDTPGTVANNGCPDIAKVQQTISMEATQIFFATNSDKLTASSWDAINKVALILNNHPELKIVIEGYSDNTGIKEKNLELSKKRAAATKKALEKSGVNANRITSAGYGPQNPIADNATAEGRLKNRRVEIKIQ